RATRPTSRSPASTPPSWARWSPSCGGSDPPHRRRLASPAVAVAELVRVVRVVGVVVRHLVRVGPVDTAAVGPAGGAGRLCPVDARRWRTVLPVGVPVPAV